MKQRILACITLISFCGLGMSTVLGQLSPSASSAPSFDDFGGAITKANDDGVSVWNPGDKDDPIVK
jgi:hypothetical protein